MADGKALVDGQGPFWIFNANGAGVAAFLKHSGTGFSFRDDKLAYARPGDFLKIFWSENVGASEKGHQVVYTGRRVADGRDMICFWSSQKQGRKKRDGGTGALYFPAAAKARSMRDTAKCAGHAATSRRWSSRASRAWSICRPGWRICGQRPRPAASVVRIRSSTTISIRCATNHPIKRHSIACTHPPAPDALANVTTGVPAGRRHG